MLKLWSLFLSLSFLLDTPYLSYKSVKGELCLWAQKVREQQSTL